MKYIDKNEYLELVEKFTGKHWDSAGPRWSYHELSAEWASELISEKVSPNSVLEIGTMGIGVIHGSMRMDYDAESNNKDWSISDPNLSVQYDARVSPWPFYENQFELGVALRVFHHLKPNQEKAFQEMKRVCKRIIIVVPEEDVHPRGISYNTFIKWNNDIPPLKYMKFKGQLGSAFLF
jgi:hypothetical protein